MQYQSRLDGIRGLAVFLVFLMHVGFLPCGWIGVHVFFVLSGFLITAILLEERTLGFSTYIKNFYARRILRVWPLYFLFCAVILIFPAPFSISSTPWTRESLLTFTYNFQLAIHQDWIHGYSHLWSIAVEEHFYLFWPFVVFLLSRRSLSILCACIIILCPLLRLITESFYTQYLFSNWEPVYLATLDRKIAPNSTFASGMFVYLFSLSHIDAFALGGLAALVRGHLSREFINKLAWTFLVIFLLSGLIEVYRRWGNLELQNVLKGFYPIHLRQNSQFIWGYTLINLASVALVLFACDPMRQGRLARFLEFKPLVWLGIVSYGFYIWSPYISEYFGGYLWVTRRILMSPLLFVVTSLVCIVSYRFFERPFLKLKRFFKTS